MSVQLAQIANWLILVAIVIVSVYFVGRDTRIRGLSWPETLAWVTVSILTFPIGFGLYFLLRRWRSRNRGEGTAAE